MSINEIIGYTLGSSHTLSEVADAFGHVDETALESALLDEGVEYCPECGWWFESGDMVARDGEDPACEDCIG